jgi:Trypsin
LWWDSYQPHSRSDGSTLRNVSWLVLCILIRIILLYYSFIIDHPTNIVKYIPLLGNRALVIDAVIARDNNNNNSEGSDSTQQQESSGFVLDPNNNHDDLSWEDNDPANAAADDDTLLQLPLLPAYQYERIRVKQELKHPLYDSTTLRYDIMLLQLDHAPTLLQTSDSRTTTTTPFPFMRLDIDDALDVIEYNSTTVLPMVQFTVNDDDTIVNRTIPNKDISSQNDDVLLALGWGFTQSSTSTATTTSSTTSTTSTTSGTGQPSDVLQQAGLGLVSNQDCMEAHEGLWLSYEDRIFDEMICTFSMTRDACYGK